MKLLFDKNLSPKLVKSLSDLFPDSEHVETCGIGSAQDAEICKYAVERDLVIITKDADFNSLSLALGAPPKVIWLRVGNCPTARIETVMRGFLESVWSFGEDAERSCLTISLRPNR